MYFLSILASYGVQSFLVGGVESLICLFAHYGVTTQIPTEMAE